MSTSGNPREDHRAAEFPGRLDYTCLHDGRGGNLPHIRLHGAVYFVTFRTSDSVPREKVREWNQRRTAWLTQHPEPHDAKTSAAYHAQFPPLIEQWLDRGYGAQPFQDATLRQLVERTLLHFNGTRYDLHGFVVASNHVHALVAPRTPFELSAVVHSWKSFTASALNRTLGKSGAFWQKEYYDHVVRTAEELERFQQYMRAHEGERSMTRLEAASTQLQRTLSHHRRE